MLEYRFVARGTLARPTPRRRAVQALLGTLLLGYAAWEAPRYGALVGTAFPLNPLRWLAVALLFYVFSDLFNIGFNRRWGRWPQGLWLAALGAAVPLDLALYGTWWGPPAGWLVFGMEQLAAWLLGVAFWLAALTGAPG